MARGKYTSLRQKYFFVYFNAQIQDIFSKIWFLSTQVHERDTQLRKQSSEMEAVLFRNQQLTKRISLLQEEADAAASKSRKSRWKRDRSASKERPSHLTVPGENSEQVINEELVSKITENAELKVRLNDIESQHSANTEALKLRISDLEKDKAELSSGVRIRETEANNLANICKLETDQLQVRIEVLEKENKEKDDKIVTLQVLLENTREKAEVLERKTSAVKKVDAEVQYKFLDEEEEENRAREVREKKSLAERLETSLGRIKQIEKDREHWKLEYQLVNLRLDKLKQDSPQTAVSLGADIDELMGQREEELKSVWEAKIEELIGTRLMADSQAMAYYLEMEALAARLTNKKREGEKLCREASTARLEEEKVREEIDTVKENYESQLSAMSDHLAMMTTKLAEQEDLIQNLNFQCREAAKKGKK